MEGAEIVVVVAGGPGAEPAHLALLRTLPPGVRVVAADGGVDRALALGLRVAVAVGDFDSVSSSGLEAAAETGARIDRYPADKDATDLELALDAALELGAGRILVLGSAEGRLDHLLSSLLLLGSDRFACVELDALLGPATVHVVRAGGEAGRCLDGSPGELVSLLALHGPAAGVVTEGLRYALDRETLEPGSSRGISNVFAATEASISLETGVLLAVRPGGEPDRGTG